MYRERMFRKEREREREFGELKERERIIRNFVVYNRLT